MEKLLNLEESQDSLITNPYYHVDITPYTDLDLGNKGHSTKRGAYSSNAHTKNRKAKRRLNKKHNKS